MSVVMYGASPHTTNTDNDVGDSCRARPRAQGAAMTTIGDRRAHGAEPMVLWIHPSRGVHPIGLVVSGVTRRAPHELPVAVGWHPGRRPPRPVAPHREEPCPPMPTHAQLGICRSWQLSSLRPCSSPRSPRCPGAATSWPRRRAGLLPVAGRRGDGVCSPAALPGHYGAGYRAFYQPP
jgi:hypothetical protein